MWSGRGWSWSWAWLTGSQAECSLYVVASVCCVVVWAYGCVVSCRLLTGPGVFLKETFGANVTLGFGVFRGLPKCVAGEVVVSFGWYVLVLMVC